MIDTSKLRGTLQGLGVQVFFLIHASEKWFLTQKELNWWVVPLVFWVRKGRKSLKPQSHAVMHKKLSRCVAAKFPSKVKFHHSVNFFVPPHEHCSWSHRIVLERKTALFTCCPLEGKAIGKSIHLSQVVQRSTAPWDHGFAIPSHELLKPITRSCVGLENPTDTIATWLSGRKQKFSLGKNSDALKRRFLHPFMASIKQRWNPALAFWVSRQLVPNLLWLPCCCLLVVNSFS